MKNNLKPEDVLRRARESKGWTQSDVAEKLGIGLRMFQKIEDGQFPKYKTEHIRKLDELLNTNLYELIYEQSADPKDEQNVPHETFLERRRGKKLKSEPFMVPFIPVKAQAGYVKAMDQDTYMETLEKYALPPGVNPQGAVWRYWETEGESMEPTLHSGDVILTSQVHHMDWDNLRNFYIYVIVTADRVMIKRVMAKNQLEWVLISDNEAQYPQQVLPVEFIKEVWVLRRVIVNKTPPPKKFVINV